MLRVDAAAIISPYRRHYYAIAAAFIRQILRFRCHADFLSSPSFSISFELRFLDFRHIFITPTLP
jgi:hypothetical protein